MPRRRRTQSGDPALPVQSVAGRRYGEGVASAQLQQALPAPARQDIAVPDAVTPPGAPPMAAPAAPAAPVDAATLYAQQLAAAQQVSGAGLLRQPSSRPNEPITTGLPTGPGAGPGILPPMRGTPTGQFYQRLTQMSGDPYFVQLAQKAGLL